MLEFVLDIVVAGLFEAALSALGSDKLLARLSAFLPMNVVYGASWRRQARRIVIARRNEGIA